MTPLLLLAVAPASGASFDPDLTWRTITTEHFEIHFHQGEEQLADEFSVTLEQIWDEMLREVRWEPSHRTEVVLVDRTDSANGYAMHLPWNTIVIYVTAPQEDSSLSLYEDWNTAIGMHEFAHILHLDANHGIVRVARMVVGRVASTNQLSPWWMVEGFATFEETRQTAGGRGRSPLVDMIKRTSVLEDEFPPLGNLDGFQADLPAGNLRYLFGQDFIAYVADRQGRDVWTRWIHTYGGHVPYWLPTRRVFGKRLVPLYYEWRDAMYARYHAQAEAIRAEGVREGRVVSDPDASCGAPSFSPDGDQLVWSCHDPRTGPAIWRSDGDGFGAEVLVADRGAKNFTWRRDSAAFVFAASHVVNRFNTFEDVYLYDIGAENVTALTNGKRARDPDFSPDGTRLVVVTNKAQDTQLAEMTVDRIVTPLTDQHEHIQFATPRFSPDGRVLAVSVWDQGRRDLWLYSTDGEPLRRLTADAASDRDPEWSHDGRWLYFVSDRTGVPNVYRIDVETERLEQITNVLTGATTPSVSPKGRWLAYEHYTHDGWEVRILDLAMTEPIDRGVLPRPIDHATAIRDVTTPIPGPPDVAGFDPTLWRGDPVPKSRGRGPATAAALVEGPGTEPFFPAPPPLSRAAWPQDEVLDTYEQAEAEDVFGEEQDYPFRIAPHRYNPLRTLVPSFWVPYVYWTPFPAKAPPAIPVPTTSGVIPLGMVFNAATGGVDTLRHFGYSLGGFYRTDAPYVGGAIDLSYNRWLPVFSVGARRTAAPSSYLYTIDEATGEPVPMTELYWEEVHAVYGSVSYPYTYRTDVFATYRMAWRDSLHPLPDEVYMPFVPARGRFGSISGGWRFAYSEPTTYAVSTEDGRVFYFVGSLLHPWLGTEVLEDDGGAAGLAQLQLAAEWREYRVNPLIPNHVIAWRASGGYTIGTTDYLGNYQLGGPYGDASLVVAPDGARMLRGYAYGADAGDMFWLGSAEYRFPIVRIDRGVGTVPFFARYLAGAVFVDAGNAFNQLETWQDAVEDPLVGVGAELKGTAIVGWSSGLTMRLGYAYALTDGGYPAADLRNVYLQFGTSF